MKLQGKKILLGLSGGIAIYKTASLLRRLTRDLGADVQVVMTGAAQKFMTPLIFETFSGKKVLTSLFDDAELVSTRHIDQVRSADLFLIVPATANIVGKAANGIGDDLLSTMLLAATPEKTCFALAMNRYMYENPACTENRNSLQQRGYHFIDAEEGPLATSVEGEGRGRLADEKVILEWIENALLGPQPLAGKKILISAGPTREYIDRVRYISNPSSGKMGIALAEAAQQMGAETELVCGPVSEPIPDGISLARVSSAEEMKQALFDHFHDADIVIMAAAVEDVRPAQRHTSKLKKNDISPALQLERTPDILLEMGKQKKDQLLVGFSVETDQIIENSRDKLQRKNLDFIVINNPDEPGAAFSADTNRVRVLDREGRQTEFPLQSKKDLAHRLLELFIAG